LPNLFNEKNPIEDLLKTHYFQFIRKLQRLNLTDIRIIQTDWEDITPNQHTFSVVKELLLKIKTQEGYAIFTALLLKYPHLQILSDQEGHSILWHTFHKNRELHDLIKNNVCKISPMPQVS